MPILLCKLRYNIKLAPFITQMKTTAGIGARLLSQFSCLFWLLQSKQLGCVWVFQAKPIISVVHALSNALFSPSSILIREHCDAIQTRPPTPTHEEDNSREKATGQNLAARIDREATTVMARSVHLFSSLPRSKMKLASVGV